MGDREDARFTFRRWGSRIKAKLAPGPSETETVERRGATKIQHLVPLGSPW